MRRHLYGIGTVVALVATFIASPAAADDAEDLARSADDTGVVSEEARSAGILAEGEAYMGWSMSAGEDLGSSQPSTAPMMMRTASVSPMASRPASGVLGVDVSGHQGRVDWQTLWNTGRRFAYVKATEGTGFRNSSFKHQYEGSYGAGMIRGSYHFGRPDLSSGARQADFFINNGGSWSADGQTLPGVLDIEYNPYGSVANGDTCYGFGTSKMIDWITSFTDRYQQRTGRKAVIYTTTDWWTRCTGNTALLGPSTSLWVARYPTGMPVPDPARVGTLPVGWSSHVFWQYSSGHLEEVGYRIDQNLFNGNLDDLREFATRGGRAPAPSPGPDIRRVAGENRYETAAKLSKQTFKPRVETVFIASGRAFPDALSGGPAAARRSAPLLLTRPGSIPGAVKDELRRLAPRSIVVLGGSAAVEGKVVEALSAYAGGKVSRWSGKDRYGTAAAVAERSHPGGANVAYIASGKDFPDGLSGTPAAAVDGAPLLLTRPQRLPAVTAAALEELGVRRVVLLGGTSAVSKGIAKELGTYGAVTRVAGEDRYDTAAAIAKRSFSSATQVVIATGTKYPDALTGGAVAARLAAPLLLTKPGSLPGAPREQLKRLRPEQVILLGGTSAISRSVETKVAGPW